MLTHSETLSPSNRTDSEKFVSQLKAEKVVPYWKGKHKRSRAKDQLEEASRNSFLIILFVRVLMIIISTVVLFSVTQHHNFLPPAISGKIDNSWYSVVDAVQGHI